jgi:hypothetical protein
LAQSYGLDWEKGEYCQKLMNKVGGHPTLVQIAFYHLSRGEMTLEHLLETSATNVGIYSHHLQRHWLYLKEYPELLTAFRSVLSGIEQVSLELRSCTNVNKVAWVSPNDRLQAVLTG